MDQEQLERSYNENQAVRAICDHMAARERNQNETKLQRMLKHLTDDGFDFKRSEVIAAFRLLEEAGCGRYVEGRHGWPSRFVWEVKSLQVSDAAKGQAPLLEYDAATDTLQQDAEEDTELIEHTFVLRPDLSVSIDLPADFTKSEAIRLAAFVQSLPFEHEG
jgi:hypothetical protein